MRAAVLLCTLLTAAACGGGGDSGPPAHYSPKGLAFSYEGTAPVSDDYIGKALDYYAEYWVLTRSAWNVTPGNLASVEQFIHFDCTFACRGSPNGLCAGQLDGFVEVAYYRLRRSITAPVGWPNLRNARTRQDMYALSNNDYWLNQDKNFFWCEDSYPPMPALLHEWDHTRFDPHDPAQNALVRPLAHTFSVEAATLAADEAI